MRFSSGTFNVVATDKAGESVYVDRDYVNANLNELVADENLASYIL